MNLDLQYTFIVTHQQAKWHTQSHHGSSKAYHRKWEVTQFLEISSPKWLEYSSYPLICNLPLHKSLDFPGGASDKEPACQYRRRKRHVFHLWVGNVLWRRIWQPTSVFLFGESHGQRSLASYSSWGQSQTRLKRLSPYTHIANEICTECFSLNNKQLTRCWCFQSQTSKREWRDRGSGPALLPSPWRGVHIL